MSAFTLFCPKCDTFLIDTGQGRALDTCPDCGWARPTGAGGEGEPIGDPIPLEARPRRDSRAIVAGGHLWLAGSTDEAGFILCLPLASAAGETDVVRVPLDPQAVAADLASDGAHIFVAPDDIDLPSTEKALVAYDAADGEEAWRYPTTARVLTPAAWAEGAVCFASEKAVYAVDSGSHQQRWVADVPVNVRTTPTMASQAVIVAGARADGRPLRALSLEDGRELWRYAHEDGFSRTPYPLEGAVYAVAGLARSGALYALDVASGEPLWRHPYVPPRRTSRGVITCPPVAAGDLVLIGCGDYFPEAPGYALHAVDRRTGELRWRVRTEKHLRVRVGVAGDCVVCADDSGQVLGLSLADGEQRWQADLGRAAATVPAFYGDTAFIGDSRGRVHGLRWRPPEALPTEPAEAFQTRGEWAMAAAAFALAGDLSAAGRALLRTNDPEHALRLFEMADDTEGRMECLGRLGQWTIVIDIHEQSGDRRALADAHRQARNHRQASGLYADLGEWPLAADEYEQAGEPEDLLHAARICRVHLDQNERTSRLYLQVAEAHGEAGRWGQAWPLFRRGGQRDRALDCLQQALEECEAERLDAQAAQLCREWAELEIELAERRALGDQGIAEWLEKGAHYCVLANQAELAAECRERAAQIMETPRFLVEISAPPEARFMEGRQTLITVRLTNVGYGPAKSVKVRLAGDVEEPYPEHDFGEVVREKPDSWDMAGVVPLRSGQLCLRVELDYASYRIGQPGAAQIEQPIEVDESSPLAWAKRAVKGGAPVQFVVEKMIAPGATNNEMTVTDSAIVARSGIHLGSEAAAPEFDAGGLVAQITDSIVVGSSTPAIEGTKPSVGEAEPAVHCAACGAAHGSGAALCPGCGSRLCCRCGHPLADTGRFCNACGADQVTEGPAETSTPELD